MPALSVETVIVGEMQVNCYLVENKEKQELLIVDPGAEGERIIAAVGKRKPVAVLLTHAHFDHIGAVDAVCGRFGIPLYVHAEDADKLSDPAKNVSDAFG
ncbi:MAG: MBL fold metallo-hydrolase, partial [Clostridia bacterium]